MYNLCCISNELKNDGHSFNTMTWKQFTNIRNKDGEDAALRILGSRWLNNVNVTGRIMRHCGLNNWGYRVSSDLFPCLTHPDFSYDIEQVPQYKSIMNEFSGIAACNAHPYLNKQIIRLSCHPDQFNVLASDNAASIDKTIKELNHHGWIMDMLGCERSHYNPINIHINCSKGDPKEIAERFVDNLFKCNDSVVSRLVVENEDKGLWTVTNLLKYIYQPYRIPITFDNLHHKCNPCSLTEDAAMEFCEFTWGDTKPLFHYSESEPNHKNIRAHADIPTDIPPNESYDWDIELKGKDAAIRQLYLIELTRESESLGLYDA